MFHVTCFVSRPLRVFESDYIMKASSFASIFLKNIIKVKEKLRRTSKTKRNIKSGCFGIGLPASSSEASRAGGFLT